MNLLFDLETNNFLDKLTTIHCLVAQDVDTDEIFSYTSSNIKEGLKLLSEAEMLIGHNIIDFDLRAIKKLYPEWQFTGKIYDTLIAAKIAYSDIKSRDFASLRSVINKEPRYRSDTENLRMKNIGKHSLEAYGLRMGEHKGTFGKDVGFEVFSQDMLNYCIQDVKVNTLLYKRLLSTNLKDDVLELEQRVQTICLEQTEFGFNFDYNKGLELEETLMKRKEELCTLISKDLGGLFIIPLEVKVPKRTTVYKDLLRGTYTKGCAYTKIKLKEFNPNSRHDLTTRLVSRFNWKPKLLGNDGKPVLNETILSSMSYPVAKLISEYLMIDKRLGMLSNGRLAWLKLYNEDTKSIHGRVNTLGAGTARCTHQSPNLAQIPSIRSPYGKECRGLFTVPKGYKLFGTDAAGLELRMLAHYMHSFDNGSYADEVLNGDIHTANQKAAGLETRNMAKTFIYAKIYGSGVQNLASVCKMSVANMKKTVKSFDENLPALKALTDAVKDVSKSRGYVKALDGRNIYISSEHASLNYLLQSAGAIVCKNWMVFIHDLIEKKGLKPYIQQLAFVHDELQIAYKPENVTHEELVSISKEAMKMVQCKFNIKISLDADGTTGETYADTH